jgi:nucleotide-binding universal stress UspA family protein
MPTMLVVGTDSVWLGAVCAAAEAAGVDVQACATVADAVAQSAADPRLVVIDADCYTHVAGPALRVLRSRHRARFVVAFGHESEQIARGLPCDVVVAKHETSGAIARELERQRPLTGTA